MKRNKRQIKYKKERVILSDVLPFEIPVTFSNRHFYNFLTSNKIQIEGNKITWENNERVINEIVKLLFDFRSETITTNEIIFPKRSLLTSIPFNFKISHKENDFRTLTLIHPKNQLDLVDFYETNKHVILHYCNVSPFSIRRADKVSRFIYHKDKTHNNKLSNTPDSDGVEENDKEYESLKTFFVYKKYGNIHKFYESYQYHRSEKKYNRLFKFDISKCFDSIYSHSISWALLNKEMIKEALDLSRDTFGNKFDTLMQNLNYGETNGIVIGPEFSRIFAELILQRIDKNVEVILREKENLIHKVDYEIFRYVDDFFVFFNNETTKDKVIKYFRLQLKEYKLYLNDEKTVLYEKPIITEITIAKQKIADLTNKYLVYKLEQDPTNQDELVEDSENEKAGSIYISSNKVITKFKTILKETSVPYKDILNYTLSLIERNVSKILKLYSEIEHTKKSEKQFTKAILEILDFTFFLYAVSPRVNTTIRLCRILRRITEFLSKKGNVNFDFKHLALKKIYDNIYFTLQKNKSLEHTQVETLYLLIALGELGKEYWLDADVLRQYVCIEKDETGKLYYKGSLNYFAIIVLLFYMRDKIRYVELRDFIKEHIKQRFSEVSPKNMGKSAELVFLLFDIITCPYLDVVFKEEMLTLNGVTDPALKNDIIKYRECWFTKWTNFDFGKELDAKHSEEVY
jgi:hypothetical protein